MTSSWPILRKKFFSRAVIILLAALAALSLCPIAHADGAGWTLEEGRLSIEGDAGMANWANSGKNQSGMKTNVKHVVIAPSVTSIPADAFNGFTALIDVSGAEGVTAIHKSAFSGCSALVSMPPMPSLDKIEGIEAFKDCTSLRRADFLKNITSISSRIFEGCTSLEEIELKSLRSISNGCFKGSGIKRAAISYQVGELVIAHEAFASCTQLEEVTLSAPKIQFKKKDGSELGEHFSGCTALRKITLNGQLNDFHATDPMGGLPQKLFAGTSDLEIVIYHSGLASVARPGTNIFDGASGYKIRVLEGEFKSSWAKLFGTSEDVVTADVHRPDLSGWKYDASKHWRACETHRDVRAYGEAEHELVASDDGDVGHTIRCALCAYSRRVPHELVWTHDARSHEAACTGCAHTVPSAAHRYGEWEWNALDHWRTCGVCGARGDTARHDGDRCETCGRTVSKIDVYKVLTDELVVWCVDDGELVIASEGLAAVFSEILIDGEPIDRGAYTVSTGVGGETTVTISAALIEMLSAGRHTITLVFEDGISEIEVERVEGRKTMTDSNGACSSGSAAAAASIILALITILNRGCRPKRGRQATAPPPSSLHADDALR